MELQEKLLELRKQREVSRKKNLQILCMYPALLFRSGSQEFPKVKETTYKLTLTLLPIRKSKIYWRYYYGSELNLYPILFSAGLVMTYDSLIGGKIHGQFHNSFGG